MADFFSFSKFCNEKIDNTTDYAIASCVIHHINELDTISIQEIASQSNTSPATVSRFFKKAGFDSYSQFKQTIFRQLRDVHLRRETQMKLLYQNKPQEKMISDLNRAAIDNLSATIEHMDVSLLCEIAYRLKHAKQVLIIGDSHELYDFYTLQIDLLGLGVSTRLVNMMHVEKFHYVDLEEDDVILYLNLFNGWIPSSLKELFSSLKKQGIYIYSMVQDSKSMEKYSTKEYVYGIKQSLNDGYISLPLLCTILNSLVYVM
jgi:DNA-binding MurR/RpiR family transcriptional regulator